jgi:aryl-alcohol dehydrogenase-like predicted oxidoreductase
VRYQEFGSTGLKVSELGLGCSRIGGVLSPSASRSEEIALLRAAVDAGINFFDTSDLYSQGQSEVLIGRALGVRRDHVIIATKGGYVVPRNRQVVAHVKPLVAPVIRRLRVRRPGFGSAGSGSGSVPIEQDFSPAYLARAVEGSLRRLRTDYIDLYQLHSPPRSVVEAGEYIAVLDDLRAQGKIRHFGIAAEAAPDVISCSRRPSVAAVQVPFSLLHQEAAHDLFPVAAGGPLAVISRSCYAAGLLRDDLSEETLRAMAPEWAQILELQRKAAGLGRPLLEAALQFSLRAESVAVTLLGMRTPAHLSDNLKLYSAPRLTEEELAAFSDEPSQGP